MRNNSHRPRHYSLLREHPYVRLPAAFLLLVLLCAVALLAAAPWQQNTQGVGRIIAYSPQDREAVVNAPKSGQVVRLHVMEGQTVTAGELLVELGDADPDYMRRLESQRDALDMRISAAQDALSSMDQRLRSLQEMKPLALRAAQAKIEMAQNKVDVERKKLKSKQAKVKQTSSQQKRFEDMAQRGLVSEQKREVTDLKLTEAQLDVSQTRAYLAEARSKVLSLKADKLSKEAEIDSKIAKAQAERSEKAAALKKYEEERFKLDSQVARQGSLAIHAPQDGMVQDLKVTLSGQYVKAGGSLMTLVPRAAQRAVELWVDGNDAALVRVGQMARVQFEGWPAIQFSGWPQASFGTFEAVVTVIAPAVDKKGKLRVLLLPTNQADWPSPDWLRQGGRAHGWVFLGEVSLGYELWRQLNGFPASVLPEHDMSEESIKKANDKADK